MCNVAKILKKVVKTIIQKCMNINKNQFAFRETMGILNAYTNCFVFSYSDI